MAALIREIFEDWHHWIVTRIISALEHLRWCSRSRSCEREIARRNQQRSEGKLKWLIGDEARTVEIMASLIVPSDDGMPGADEVEVLGDSVVNRLDELVFSSAIKQKLYTEGLLSLDRLAVASYGTNYVRLDRAQQQAILVRLDAVSSARSGKRRITNTFAKDLFLFRAAWKGWLSAIKFFSLIKQDVIEVFYTSKVCWTWLDYDGPPMPDGYQELDVKRAKRTGSLGQSVKELAVAGYGIAIPIEQPKIETPDVVVVGSGAGGAVVTKELAESGLTVVVIEAGRRFNPYLDYQTDRQDFELAARKAFEDPRNESRDLYTLSGNSHFQYGRVKGVGGTTLKYAACSPRFHESDFRVRSEDGLADDWPISYEELEPYYSLVEQELGVSGPEGSEANPFEPPRSRRYPTPAHPFNLATLTVKRGADKLGLHLVREPLAIPSIDRDGRPACINAGTCTLGCAIAAKSSMDVTYIRKAERTGRVELRTNCTAFRVTLDPSGKVRGVMYLDEARQEREVLARAVVLAGNAVETPRLLLLSETGLFPDGLANSSGLVGKYFTEHLAVCANGFFPERMDPWRGTYTGGFYQDHYATREKNAFARGWTTYVAHSQHWPLATAKKVPGWGMDHKLQTRRLFSHYVGLTSVGEQIPDIRNQVTLDPGQKDCYGLPVPRLAHRLGDNDRAMIESIRASYREVLEAAGSTEILEDQYIPGFSAHYMGTCRMGLNPSAAVVNAWGRTHDVKNLFIADGSLFVTVAAVNPALTISALATRIAHGIVDAFMRRDL